MAVNATFEKLATRQARLVILAAQQRGQLAATYTSLEKPFAWLQAALVAVKAIRAHPRIALVGGLAGFLALGSHISKVRGWMIRGLASYQLYKILQSLRRAVAGRVGKMGWNPATRTQPVGAIEQSRPKYSSADIQPR